MLSTRYLKLHHSGCDKLLPRYVGPFRVTDVINPVAFRLKLPSTMRIHNVFHASLLKVFRARPGYEPHPHPMIIEDHEEYEVEALIQRRWKPVASHKKANGTKVKRGRWEYYVRWAGYGPEHDQWLPETELVRNCKEMLKAFETKFPKEEQEELTPMLTPLEPIKVTSTTPSRAGQQAPVPKKKR